VRNVKLRILLTILLAVLGVFIAPSEASAAVQRLNGQTGQIQAFQNDTNVAISSLNNIHSLNWQGLLPVSRGGTGTNSFSAGSLLFSNGTSISQDNPNLFWDDTNNRLGIGTTQPTSALDVIGSVSISENLEVTGDIISTNLVPYTGAVGDVNLGTHDLTVGLQISSSDPSNFIITALSATSGDTGGAPIEVNAGYGFQAGAGGDLNLNAGTGGNTGNGGGTGLYGGSGGATSGDGGLLQLSPGSAQGVGNGGDLKFFKGFGAGGGTDGNFKFYSGNNDTTPAVVLDTSILTTSDKVFIFPDASGTLGLLEANQTWSGLNKFEVGTNSTIYIGSSVKSGCIAIGDSDGSGVTYIIANDGVLTASVVKPSICQ